MINYINLKLNILLIKLLFLSFICNAQTWVELGPNKATNTGIGRVTSVTYDPVNPDIIYIGAAYGGIWKTIDGGQNFSVLNTDIQLETSAVTYIEIDPSNGYLYLSTGDWIEAPQVGSKGVYRSIDNGLSYQKIANGLPTGFYTMHELFLYNSNTIFVSTNKGIYRTDNATAISPTWTKVGPTMPINNIIKDPSNSSILYAGGYNILKSTDAGFTWTSMTGSGTGIDFNDNIFTSKANPVGDRRFDIAIAPNSPHILYANIVFTDCTVMSNWACNNYQYLFKFNGSTWDNLGSRLPGIAETSSKISSHFRDIIVSPTDSKIVYLSGTQLGIYNGNTGTFTKNSSYNTINFHADIVDLNFSPFDPNILYVCTEGFLNKYNCSGNSWFSMPCTGLGNATIYGCSFNPNEEKMLLVGTQDDGTSARLNNGSGVYYWSPFPAGGDGYKNLIQPNPNYPSRPINYWFQDNVTPKFHLCNYWQSGVSSYTDVVSPTSDRPGWNDMPIEHDPIDPSVIYHSGRNLWKHTNYGYESNNTTPKAPIAISNFSSYIGGSGSSQYGIGPWQVLNTFDISISDNKVIYAAFTGGGTEATRLFKTTTGGGTGVNDWTEIIVPQPLNHSVSISDVVVSPFDPETIYITYKNNEPGTSIDSNYRVKKYNGSIWVDYNNSKNLPTDRNIRCLLYEKGSMEGIYIGTDIGIFYTNAFMNSWIPISSFPNTIVNELKLTPQNRYLYAATYGRGLWGTTLPCPASISISIPGATIPMNNYYETNSSIIASASVPNIGATYKAGTFIELNPGFINSPSSGSRFLGYIYKCYGGANILPKVAANNYEDYSSINTESPNTNNISENDLINVYPIPSIGPITIKISLVNETVKEITIYDIQGRKLKKLNPKLKEQQIDLSEEQQGYLIIKVITDKRILEKKIFLQKTTDEGKGSHLNNK